MQRGARGPEHGDPGVGGHGGVATLSTNPEEEVAGLASEAETALDFAATNTG